jgi:hypothetical protein
MNTNYSHTTFVRSLSGNLLLCISCLKDRKFKTLKVNCAFCIMGVTCNQREAENRFVVLKIFGNKQEKR